MTLGIRRNVWTGAETLSDPEKRGRMFGLLAASSTVDSPGSLRIDLAAEFTRIHPDGSITVLLSEPRAAVLCESLTRTLARIVHLRAMHRLGLLKDEAYTDSSVDDVDG